MSKKTAISSMKSRGKNNSTKKNNGGIKQLLSKTSYGRKILWLSHTGLGIIFLIIAIGIVLALVSHNPSDPSFTTAHSGLVHNWLGYTGAAISDLLINLFGTIASYVLCLIFFIWSIGTLICANQSSTIKPPYQLAITPDYLHLVGGLVFIINISFGLILFSYWLYYPKLDIIVSVFTDIPTSVMEQVWQGLGQQLLPEFYYQFGRMGIFFCFIIWLIATLFFGYWVLGITKHGWRIFSRLITTIIGFLFYLILTCISALLGFIALICYRGLTAVLPIARVLLPKPLRLHQLLQKFSATATWQKLWRDLKNDLMPKRLQSNDFKNNDANLSKPMPFLSNDTKDDLLNIKPLVKDFSKNQLQNANNLTDKKSYFNSNIPEQWRLPSLDLLKTPAVTKKTVQSREQLSEQAILLKTSLEEFGIKGEIVAAHAGPVVTLFELEPARGIKTARIINLSADLARALSALSVRIATLPGRSVLGIEVANKSREIVFLKDILTSQLYQEKKYKLPLALGKNISGRAVLADLSTMPHLLVAGTTGSGKSVGMNGFILSLLFRYNPNECRLLLIDPKMLELSVYDDIPHLITPVVTDAKKSIIALKWVVLEMERRYRVMSELGVRNLEGYHQKITETKKPLTDTMGHQLLPMPFIVVVVDEMADLMLVAGKEIEISVQRLAQMARAAGIHLIMATQRPSVDVVTGTIKANFPTRISYAVTSRIDSRTILGQDGAEQLLGRGDLLLSPGGTAPIRVHGPLVTDGEVTAVANWWKQQGKPQFWNEVTEEKSENLGSLAGNSNNELYNRAVELVVRQQRASTSFLQRHLQIGYNRAASLIEQMEQEGIVSSANHVGKRDVFKKNL